MKVPQIIYLALIMMDIGISLAKHGEPKNEKYNVWITLASAAIIVALLKWGGFF